MGDGMMLGMMLMSYREGPLGSLLLCHLYELFLHIRQQFRRHIQRSSVVRLVVYCLRLKQDWKRPPHHPP